MPLDPALRQRISDLLAANRVVLFMKGQPDAPQCGFSAQAAGTLRDLDVAFAHVDVLADPDIREGIKHYGDWPTIPQLYIDGELVGGSDIIVQMAGSGELQAALGLPPPDRTPPAITVTPAALAMLKQAVADAGGEMAVEIAIDRQFRTRLHLVQPDANAVQVRHADLLLQFPANDARRADGLTLDFADDARGKGLVIDNPNAPKPVRDITPAEAAERVRAGTLTLVDVRPRAERALAAAPVACLHFDDGPGAVDALDKSTPLAFLCHAGGRSRQAAEHYRQQGFREVCNVEGGIDAWAVIDPSVPRY
ncbi:Grx4 family monothiol glutaredoxin [Lysobacter pythonis]|uniref:Grx4 family monothiol glutaredoxin n=1 Tax=Solilutibacter pythonis TaxID=2483112 RepID=A0A3M2I4Q8_9GAMM|nr:Grx4 family monothiol glutaredoxin [Lysobacter pythonis]RMH93214.1 Grx4 family monothiol glutaredoxin [Lysobacter pythonis]